MSALSSGDAGLWLEVEPPTGRNMLLAAVELFAERGYHATTTRSIADRAGLSPAAVYVHYRSKLDLLLDINAIGHAAVLADVQRALEGVEAPADRLRELTRAFVSWHARNHTLARVIQYELRAIPADRYGEIRKLRRRFESIFQAELRRGLESGDFTVGDLRTTTVALLSLGIDVARWYTGRGTSPAALGEAYGELALRMVGASESG
jgi:AcrR family transcriptional regulator